MTTKALLPFSARQPQPDSEPGHAFFGRHLLVSYHGCPAAKLSDRAGLLQAMRQAARASGATVLSSVDHAFASGGLTAVLLLAESHASIHTYPEHGACFVDLFTCGQACQAEVFDAVMRRFLRPTGVDRRVLLRAESSVEDCFHAA